ncbi:MAG: TIGR03564 family F420-dependent LLM class oxidoreductase [Frankiaceae bacterium]|nr:TIGR03564 family F420-dependent LLM class oxidoreductase [Frankiaceae bacterium]MBV9872647.1 TIGR03564 family F420-dependent LLM class oxidoreductase [Frankiaceae bacterium]
MRIGMTGAGSGPEAVVRQAQRAEADGFTSLWFASAILGDPLVGMALAGQSTERIELGTSVLVTYACHPVLQAKRVAAVAAAIGTPGRLTLGIGPSHDVVVEGALGLSYSTVGQHVEEYVEIVTTLLRGEPVAFSGKEFRANADPPSLVGDEPIPVLLGALAPRSLRVAGRHAAGTILWMGNAVAIRDHIAPRLTASASDAGRPAPRIVAGLPIAVHDDVAEARETAAKQFAIYDTLPNYQRLMARGGVSSAADVAVVGNEESVAEQIRVLFDAGMTDLWAAPFAVGEDATGSRARTRALLSELARS